MSRVCTGPWWGHQWNQGLWQSQDAGVEPKVTRGLYGPCIGIQVLPAELAQFPGREPGGLLGWVSAMASGSRDRLELPNRSHSHGIKLSEDVTECDEIRPSTPRFDATSPSTEKLAFAVDFGEFWP